MKKGHFEHYDAKKMRIRILGFLFVSSLVVLSIGLFARQVIFEDDYVLQGEKQAQRRIIQPGSRGNIYDCNGHLIVGSRPLFTAAIYIGELRKELSDAYLLRLREARESGQPVDRLALQREARLDVLQAYLDELNHVLGREESLDPARVDRFFQQRILVPMPLVEDLSVEEYATLAEYLSVDAPVQVIVSSARYYPYGSLAAHVLGYVASTDEIDAEDIPGEHLRTFKERGKTGKSGVELYFNDQLEGKSGYELWQVDPVGFQYQLIERELPEQGDHLTLTLDLHDQFAAEVAMEGKRGALVALDVKTGEVRAMVSVPNYNLNELSPRISTDTYQRINEEGAWLNRAIQGLYPPASTFKVLTTIAALRKGILDRALKIDAVPRYKIGNRWFPENNPQGWGIVNVVDALAVSSNVFFYPISTALGGDPLCAEAKRFALGAPTGIELPFESKRMFVPTPEWKKKRHGEAWWEGDSANLGMGQGYIQTTPLNVACMTASLARKQTRTWPSLLPGKGRAEGPPVGLSEDEFNIILEGMLAATQRGVAKAAAVEGVDVAAKTGTGQMYLDGRKTTIAWTIAFAPIEDPEIAVAVIIEPEAEGPGLWGGTAAAPVVGTFLEGHFAAQE